MATLIARAVTASYGAEEVLHGVDVTVGPGVRLGLLGPNGAGKSTLLRILAGEIAPDRGSVSVTGTVGLLPQEPDRRAGEQLLGYLARRTGVTDADATLQAAAAGLDGGDDAAATSYADALQRWLDLGGADLDARAVEVCGDLGLPADLLDVETSGLSGGQMARASLAAVLLSRYDVLLLDEPTNDLDLDGLARLEDFVTGLRGGLVVVSHDREFLARCVTAVLELDPHNRVARQFAGGWDAYVEERAVARRQAREQYDDFVDRREELQGRVQSTREMSVRGAVRAKRKAPDNDRAARGARMEAATSAASKVRSLETRLRRLDGEAVQEPRKEWQLRLDLPAAPRSGDAVAVLRSAVVRLGAFTLGPVDVDVRWADRVAVVGPNGGGKTTLLQALLGRLPLVSGTATLGPGVVVGELDQARRSFAGEATVVDVVRRTAPDLLPEEVRTLLAKFDLKGPEVGRAAGSLSPGERTRAGLAVLMARGTNCLVLDEPTNHLDLPAIEQLEEALASYGGTLLLVTHDRRLLEAVPLTRTLHVVHGQVTESG
ncbi:MAG TPA: ABC-F family ATP-binding cassette domain-containing protein [Mycobacteriales bacterium]|nr:ABC-F family ATP-binding cassette domain-containing protein [Mycobacteriales bacterium]